MKLKYFLSTTVLSLALLGLMANASTPQEDIARYTEYINQNAKYGPANVATDYAERAIAYAKAGQWQNCLDDCIWLKMNKIYTWSSYRGLAEARTKAYLALGRTDEAVKDMYETFLAGAHSEDLRRLKAFISQNPQYSNYLDLNARAEMIQQYASSAKEMWTSADYTSGVRSTENGWYMLQVAEKMSTYLPVEQRYSFYDVMSRIAYDRYSICKYHSDNTAYNVSDSTKDTFIANGAVDCSKVMSTAGMSETLRVAETFGQIAVARFGYMRQDTKAQIAEYKKANVAYTPTPVSTTDSNSSYNSSSLPQFDISNNGTMTSSNEYSYPLEPQATVPTSGATTPSQAQPYYNDWSLYESQQKVQAIGQKLLANSNISDLGITFKVSDEPTVNAYADGNRNIVVFTGLLKICESEDELAFILSHEIAHIAGSHILKGNVTRVATNVGTSVAKSKLSGLRAKVAKVAKEYGVEDLGIPSDVVGATVDMAGSAVVNYHSRAHEVDADTVGMDIMKNANYNPMAGIAIMYRIGDNYNDIFVDHPSTDKRVVKMYNHASENFPTFINQGYNSKYYKEAISIMESKQ